MTSGGVEVRSREAGGTTPDGMLLCLIGGFLALLELQAEIDGSASVAGVVVTAAD